MNIARTFFISGLVQGVGFRFFAQRSAATHQVLGYVRNLKDGRVEAYVEGTENAVKAFYMDILSGPSYSRVEDVEEITQEPRGEYRSFLVES